LIGPFLERENFPNEKNKSSDDKDDSRPAELGPGPEPIAFGMKRTLFAERRCAKSCENWLKIAEPDPDPRRVA